MRNVYKLQIWLTGDEGKPNYWQNFYLDVNSIIGFFIQEEKGNEMPEEDSICLMYRSGECDTIKREDHIEKYLLEQFCSELVVPK